MEPLDGHQLTLIRVPRKRWIAECQCGWEGPECPNAETAAEFWGLHFASVMLKLMAANS